MTVSESVALSTYYTVLLIFPIPVSLSITETHTEWTEKGHRPIALSSPACLCHDGWRWLAPRPHTLHKRHGTRSQAGHRGIKGTERRVLPAGEGRQLCVKSLAEHGDWGWQMTGCVLQRWNLMHSGAAMVHQHRRVYLTRLIKTVLKTAWSVLNHSARLS